MKCGVLRITDGNKADFLRFESHTSSNRLCACKPKNLIFFLTEEYSKIPGINKAHKIYNYTLDIYICKMCGIEGYGIREGGKHIVTVDKSFFGKKCSDILIKDILT
jgi:hypothetical protein